MTANELFQGIDGEQLKLQRLILSAIVYDGHRPTGEADLEALVGLQNLLDCVADVAHDEYGKDTLFLSAGG